MAKINGRHFCDWCGDEACDPGFGEPASCGRRECERELRYSEQVAESEAHWEAERDGYARYR